MAIPFQKIKKLEIEEKSVELEIVSCVIADLEFTPWCSCLFDFKWDTAGSERFRSLTNSNYRNSNVVIIIFDLAEEVRI